MNINELNQKINEAESFCEIAGIIENERYFAEFKENANFYYSDWILDVSTNDLTFATIANFDKEQEKEYHIECTIDDDIETIQKKIEQANEIFDKNIISVEEYSEEIEKIISVIKIKNAELVEL